MVVTPDAIYQKILLDLAPYLDTTDLSYSGSDHPSYIKRAAAEALRVNFLRKEEVQSERADAVALLVFRAANEGCLRWRAPLEQDSSEADRLLWGTFVKTCEDFFLTDLGSDVDLTWGNILTNARSGPGVAVGAQGTSFYSKHFSGPLTATHPSLIDVYKADTWLWPEFSNAENIRQENFGSPVYVKGSRTSFVPKSIEVSRMICVEPTVNMYLQLGIGEIISKRLLRFFGIDLSTQPSVNRLLARMGSLIDSTFGDGFATIDLSSASDTLSLGLMGSILPAEWLSTMLEVRSHETIVKGCTEYEKLHMMSTMGNGFTFPLQTAVFACAAAACVSLNDDLVSHARAFGNRGVGQFSVFGDDIVIHNKVAERMLHLLRMMGCQPNMTKCFNSGNFRESCGHDYLNGHNIRPIFLRKLKTEADLVVLTNLLSDWSMRTGVLLQSTIAFLLGQFTAPLVPRAENMDAGIRVPLDTLRAAHARLGYQKYTKDGNGSWVYHRRQSRPTRLKIGDGTIHVPRNVKYHIYNPSGLLMSYLKGEIRSCSISVFTTGICNYDTKLARTPNWDYVPVTYEDRLIGPAYPQGIEFTTRSQLIWDDPCVLRALTAMLKRYDVRTQKGRGLKRRRASP